MRFRFFMLAAVCALSACEQVVNRGPVAGAAVTVAPLRGGTALYTGSTTSPESVIAQEGEPAWIAGSDAVRLQKLGRVDLPDGLPMVADSWYLLTASGGSDFDIDRNSVIESATGTPVLGQLHAILRGSQLGSTAIVVSPLTEAGYQFVADYLSQLTDAEVGQALDELATDLVSDVDNTGAVDYTDVLWSNRLFATDRTLPDKIAGVEALASAIAAGAGEGNLRALARELSSRNAPRVVAESVYAADIHEPVIVGKRCESCHLPGGLGSRASNNVVVADSDPEYAQKNTENFRLLVLELGVEGVLERARGVGHGGGGLLFPSDPEYDGFEAWLNLL